MSDPVVFERIEQDPYSALTQQAAELLVRDLYRSLSDPRKPVWSDVNDRIGQIDEIGQHFVVHEAGIVFGVIAVRDSIDGTSTKIVELVTNRFTRHSGFGRRLIEGVAQRALEAGHSSVQLNPADSAIPFYRKLGFELAHPGKASTLTASVETLLSICSDKG